MTAGMYHAQCQVYHGKYKLKPLKPFHEMSNPRIRDAEQKIFYPEHEVTEDPKTWRNTVEGVCSICGHKVWIQKENEEYALANGIICTCCVYSQIKKEDFKEIFEAIKGEKKLGGSRMRNSILAQITFMLPFLIQL